MNNKAILNRYVVTLEDFCEDCPFFEPFVIYPEGRCPDGTSPNPEVDCKYRPACRRAHSIGKEEKE